MIVGALTFEEAVRTVTEAVFWPAKVPYIVVPVRVVIVAKTVLNSEYTFRRLTFAKVLTFRVVTLAKGVERLVVLTVSAWSESTFAPSTTLRPNKPVLVVCMPTLPSGSMTIANV